MTPHQEFTINKLLADFEGLEYLKPGECDTLLFNYKNAVLDYSCDWDMLIKCYNRIAYYFLTHQINSDDFRLNDIFLLCPFTKTLRCEPFFIKLGEIVNLINLNKHANP